MAFSIRLIQYPPTLGEIGRGFIVAGERMGDLESSMGEVVDILIGELNANWEGTGRSWPWAPLAESTVERKDRLGLDPRILMATGKLRERMTARDEWVLQREGDDWSALLFDPTGYTWYHVDGFHDRGGGWVDPRNMTFVSDAAINSLMEVFGSHIDRSLEAVPG